MKVSLCHRAREAGKGKEESERVTKESSLPRNEYKCECKEIFKEKNQGWSSGGTTRLPTMWPASNPGVDATRELSLLLVLLLAPRGFFAGYSGFPISFKFQFDLERTDTCEFFEELVSAPWLHKLRFAKKKLLS